MTLGKLIAWILLPLIIVAGLAFGLIYWMKQRKAAAPTKAGQEALAAPPPPAAPPAPAAKTQAQQNIDTARAIIAGIKEAADTAAQIKAALA